MFSQDVYPGTFGPSPVINFTLEAIALSIAHERAPSKPHTLWHYGILVSTPEFSLVPLSHDLSSSISSHRQFLLFQCFSILPIWIGTSLSHSARCPAPPSFPCSTAWVGSSSIATGAPIMHSALPTHSFPALLPSARTSQSQLVFLCLDWHSSISFRTFLTPSW